MFRSHSIAKKESFRQASSKPQKGDRSLSIQKKLLSSPSHGELQFKTENTSGLSKQELFQLQQSIGNQAVTQLLQLDMAKDTNDVVDQEASVQSPPIHKSPFHDQPIQRVIEISGERYTHGSKKVSNLYNYVVAPWLEQNEYKTYGIKSRLVEFIKNNDIEFNSNDHFLTEFIPWLQLQTRKVKGDKTTPVLKKFSIGKMSRPKWSNELKQKLDYQNGDNIRHVIRNATLKRALEIEYNRYLSLDDKKERFYDLADTIGIASGELTIDILAQEIYNKVYLNEANLFSGDGPYNQIIGFAADRVKQYGEELIALEDDIVDTRLVAGDVKNLISVASSQAGFGHTNAVTNDLHTIVDTVINEVAYEGYRIDMMEAELIGDLVIDIGLNFGFDLIDGRVTEDQDNIAQRQGLLLQVETELQQFLASDGQTGDIKNIFQRFLEISRS
ncbi:hypothetical protein [Bacillus horti]|uniref:Uncharacterized protein n=1 Tax=Caldalkalibacillus horti TaxID=77523 RepID=A0ABT9W1K4_9BACI|nr:hypothetical protein [Bacillus horti]MDQ0167096.1 hypothetical protein [Bacillus horti]